MRRRAHGDATPRGQRRLPRGPLVLTVSLLWLAALAVPAGAHATLVETVPADGEEAREAPEEVALVFSEPMQPPARLEVTDPEGASVVAGEPEIDGQRVSVELEPLEAQGTHTVEWRAVSADDHPLEGTLSFDLVEGPEAPSDEAGEPTAPAEEDRGDRGREGTREPEGAAPAETEGQAALEGGGDTSAPAAEVLPWLLVTAGVAAIGSAGAAAVVQRRHPGRSAGPG